MADTTYFIVFDPFDSGFNPKAIKKALREDDSVSHWWNHLFNCFIVTSRASSETLTRRLRTHAPDVSFLVSEANLKNTEGLLPERSWDWIRERELEAASKTTIAS